MCDLFTLNFSGPNYISTKCVNHKGVQFILGKHVDIFWSMAEIYQQTKKTYIIFGPIHVILSEDETKVKTMVVWNSHWDTLKEFCCPRDNHVCVSN